MTTDQDTTTTPAKEAWEDDEHAPGKFVAAVRIPNGDVITGVGVAWIGEGRGFYRVISPDDADRFADELRHHAAEVRVREDPPAATAVEKDEDDYQVVNLPTDRL